MNLKAMRVNVFFDIAQKALDELSEDRKVVANLTNHRTFDEWLTELEERIRAECAAPK